MSFSLLLVSKDKNTVKSIETLSKQKNINLILQPVMDSVILTTLENKINLFFYDMVTCSENDLDTLNVIINLNPKLPIVVLTDDNTIDTLKALAQLKIFYCALKPIQIDEIESIIDAIKSKSQKDMNIQKDYTH